MKTYKEAIDHINSFVNFEKKGLAGLKNRSNLDVIREVLQRAGNPDESFKAIHIAGTKGKGSISVFTAALLSEHGYKTGLFTSPHLHTVRERISINGSIISEKGFVDTFERLRDIADDILGKKMVSYFEIIILMCFLYFMDKKIDFAVFECGLGGRLDATNVVHPVVCGFSPIGHDHMDILGETIGQIAAEKAAIIKKRISCVTAPQNAQALRVIEGVCKENWAELSIVGEDIRYDIKKMDLGETVFDVRTGAGSYNDLVSNMKGDFQVENCAVAVSLYEKAVESIGQRPDPLAVSKGALNASLPGRMELISSDPRILLDGAQTSESAKRLKYCIEDIFKYDKLILLLGISADKDIKGVCGVLRELADEIVITRSFSSRAADPFLIKGYMEGCKTFLTKDVKEALGTVFGRVNNKNDLVLATGSFYLVAEVREEILGIKGER